MFVVKNIIAVSKKISFSNISYENCFQDFPPTALVALWQVLKNIKWPVATLGNLHIVIKTIPARKYNIYWCILHTGYCVL